MAYTTTDFLTSVERQSFSPANQATFTTADILSLGDEVLQATVLPALLGAQEEYLVTYTDYSIVSGTAAYALPERAIGMGAREIQLINQNGSVTDVPRTSLDRLDYFSSTPGNPRAFYLRGDEIVLVPTPSSSSATMRVYYALRPGALVEVSAGAVISSINTGTNQVTVSTIPSTWVTGNIFDLISAKGGQRHLSIGLTSTLVSGTTITLPSLPSGLAVGDYVNLQGESSLIQLPSDLRPALATLVAAEMIIGMSQPQGDRLYAKGTKQLESAIKLLSPRVTGEEELILPDWT